MKIAHVVDSMEIGGAEMLVLQLCRLQREQGHNPSVYAIKALGPLGEQMRAEGFEVTANVGRHLLDSMISFYRAFRRLRPDVVHLHNPTPTIYAGGPAKLAGAKRVISTRHSLVAPPHNTVMERKYAIAARFCNWVVGICDATTANIRAMKTVAERKLVRIYNGTIAIPACDAQKLPAKDGFTLLYVGRLEPVKNHELLLTAFRSALDQAPGLYLWMVGDGSQRTSLERLTCELNMTDRVRFWGQQLEVAPFYRAADGFVMSSRSEGLPMSLLQALSVGLPAIVTDVGGMAEIVRLANAGLIVAANNPAEMATAIVDLAKTTAMQSEFSKNGEAAFQQQFTLRAMADQYMQLYHSSPVA